MPRIITFILALFWIQTAAFAADLQTKDVKIGTGETVLQGSEVSVHYTGWLLDGTKFDSSRDRGQPFTFMPGAGQVIAGWEKGVVGMKVGGIRELVIPPELGYGKRGAGGVIPPDATLKFEVEVVAVLKPKFTNIDNDEVQKLLDQDVKIIDIRRPDEWKQTGVIDGSHLMTVFDKNGKTNPNFLNDLEKLVGKDEKFMLICRTGNRTGVVSKYLSEKAGYSGVNNVTNGITGWIKQNRSVNEKPVMPENCWLC